MAIICVRHTRPLVAEGICYGRMDLDITESFEREAQAVIDALSPPDIIISSPLKRCRKLATRLNTAFDRPVEIDLRLSEMDFGSWEGVAWDAVPRSEIEAWTDNFLHANPHGGESVAMLRERVMDAYRDYAIPSSSVLWVCHAGVVKAVMSRGDTADDFNTSIGFGGVIALPEHTK